MARRATLALVVVALAYAGAGCVESASPSPDVESLDEAIVGGRTTTAHQAVGYLAGRGDDEPFCVATLVEPTYIVTAAHCVRDEHASSLVFGTGKFHATQRRTNIVRCKYNPKFRPSSDATLIYDFAFCQLESAITNITPMAMVSNPAASAKYAALGYGQTDPDDEDSGGPRKLLDVRRVDPDDEPFLEGLEEMLAVTSARGDTCFGDSGSPLLVIAANGTARIAGVLNGGISGEDDSDCGGGGIGIYAPIAKNLTFFATR